MSRWLSSVIAIGCAAAGCATATNATSPNNGPDASTDNSHDANNAPPIDAPAQEQQDAHQQADAHQSTQIDAAQTSGNCSSPFSGTLATWDMDGASGSQTSTAVMSTAAGGTASALSRSSALAASSGANSINSNTWSTSSSNDKSTYYTVTITPPAGCTVSVTGVSMPVQRSSTGPADGAVGTSADSFGSTTSFSPPTTSATLTPSLSASDVSGQIEVRIFAWDASSTNGTMRISDSMTISGSFQ